MSINNKKQLPDTPWHIGYAYKDENDPRRHKARCIHITNQKCYCSLSGCYMTTCVGSAHCKYYTEDEAQWDEYLAEMKTSEDLLEESTENRALIYRKEKQAFVQSILISGTYTKKYRLRPQMINRPFCLERLKDLQCKYCLAKFKVVEDVSDEEIRNAAQRGYFLIKSI